MTGLFEVLAGQDREEQERLTGTRAAIAAQTRAKARFEGFLSKAGDEAEFEARLALIDSNLRDLANEAAVEYDSDPERTYLAATVALGGGHASDCTCGFCENMGNLPGSKSEDEEEEEGEEKEASVKTACKHCSCNMEDCNCSEGSPCGHDGCKFSKEVKMSKWQVVADGALPETGDHYQQERVDLPSNDDDGLGGPSPEIDKGKSGDEKGWSLDPIDVDSVRNKLEKQEIDQWTAEDYHDRVVLKNDKLNDPDFLKDLSSPTHDDSDVTKSVGPPDTDRTKTFPNQKQQADPVTDSVLSKWQVVE